MGRPEGGGRRGEQVPRRPPPPRRARSAPKWGGVAAAAATGAAAAVGAAAARAVRRRPGRREGGGRGGAAAAAGAARRRPGRRGGGGLGGAAAAAGAARRRRPGRRGGGGGGVGAAAAAAGAGGAAPHASARARRDDETTTVAGPQATRLALSKGACHDPEPRERAQTSRNLPIGPVAEHWWSSRYISICCDIGDKSTFVLSSPDSKDEPTKCRGWLGGDRPQSAVGTSAEWSGGPKFAGAQTPAQAAKPSQRQFRMPLVRPSWGGTSGLLLVDATAPSGWSCGAVPGVDSGLETARFEVLSAGGQTAPRH